MVMPFFRPGDLELDLVGSFSIERGGSMVGARVGDRVGDLVGDLVGDFVGSFVGDFVGDLDCTYIADALSTLASLSWSTSLI